MLWYQYLSYFWAGAFLCNAIPHFVCGVAGRPFQSPFAKPPGKGLSSSKLNVAWGGFNLVVGYLLLFQVGAFDPHDLKQVLPLATGFLGMGFFLANTFAKFHGGNI